MLFSFVFAKVEGLQGKLTQAQVNLKKEKQSRRRKEKNIVKLATELGRKQTEASQQEQDVVKVSRSDVCIALSFL